MPIIPISILTKQKSKSINNKKANEVNDQFKSKFKCNFCGACYATKKTLRAHKNVHEGKYDCDVCGFKAPYPIHLKLHKEAKHEGSKTYKCTQCNYTTGWQICIRRHKKAVHEGKTYYRTQCEFTTFWPGYLRRHKRPVHEGQIYECPQCRFKAARPKYLERHIVSCQGKQM